jgi:hypothetical protein
MSQIQFWGITQPLWTYTRFLSASPIIDTYGGIETPENSGLIANAKTGIIKIHLDAPTAMPTSAAAPMTPGR